MLASAGGRPFNDPDWLYEIKFDGYRTLARFGDGDVEMRTKNGANCTAWYPEVAQALAQVPGGPYIIDGEACVLDDFGRSDFNRLQTRARRRRWYSGCDQVTLCVFDLLVDGGRDIMALPLTERKGRLATLLSGVPKSALLLVGDLPADAALFDQAVVPFLLEGFVAKRRASPYQPGVRSRDWIKVKRKGAVPPERFRR
jgi:bifunctional non-homologous end joining protein LigD